MKKSTPGFRSTLYELLFNKRTLCVFCIKPTSNENGLVMFVTSYQCQAAVNKNEIHRKNRIFEFYKPHHFWSIIKYHSILLCVHVRARLLMCRHESFSLSLGRCLSFWHLKQSPVNPIICISDTYELKNRKTHAWTLTICENLKSPRG